MKQLILLSGLCFLTTVSYSQQASSSRNGELKRLENQEMISKEIVVDSVATVHSMARNGKPVPVTKETDSNTGSQSGKVIPISSAKKPE